MSRSDLLRLLNLPIVANSNEPITVEESSPVKVREVRPPQRTTRAAPPTAVRTHRALRPRRRT